MRTDTMRRVGYEEAINVLFTIRQETKETDHV